MKEKKTILIIDDEKVLVEMLKARFEKSYNVLVAYDGKSGLEITNESKPHLIILDINMPKMNGIEFYGNICSEDKKPRYPILVLTARGELESLFKDIDVDGFITKPFRVDELNKEIEIIITKRYGSHARRRLDTINIPKKVLIVEDDGLVSDKLAVKFLNAGYTVTSSNSGMDAVEKVLADVPDLLVIKLGLSDLSGDIVIAKLKHMPRTMDMAVVVYTPEDKEINYYIAENISRHIGVRIVPSDNPSLILEKAKDVLKEI